MTSDPLKFPLRRRSLLNRIAREGNRAITLLCLVGGGCLAGRLSPAETAARDFLVVPDSTNAVRFRLYTNASPDAARVFNTFAIEAYGTTLLSGPVRDALKPGPAVSPAVVSLHNVLVDGTGPELASTNGMRFISRASGPDWQYVLLDVSAAYRSRVKQFSRGVLFVEPDLFVLYDQLIAEKPVSFQMQLHPSAAVTLDTNWGDLHLDFADAALTIHSPGRRHDRRPWTRIASAADAILPGTVTAALGPTNKLSEFHVLTVFAIRRGDEKKDFAFKLLESSRAIGAQIQRNGLPTIVAFKTDASTSNATLTGFEFSGPVGVYVFRPEKIAR